MKKWQKILISVVLLIGVSFFVFKNFYASKSIEGQLKSTSSGLKLIEEGNWESASQFFEKEISLNPKNAQAHLQLAILYADYLGKTPLAIQHYETYLLLAPTDEKTVLVYQWLKNLKGEGVSELSTTISKNTPARDVSEQKTSILNAAKGEIDSLKTQLEEQRVEIQRLTEAVIAKENLMATTQEQLKNNQNQKTQQEALHAKWILAKKDYDSATKQIEDLKQEKEVLAGQIDDLTQSNESLARTVQDLTGSKQVLEQSLQELQKKQEDSSVSRNPSQHQPYLLMAENKKLREQINQLKANELKLTEQIVLIQESKMNAEATKTMIQPMQPTQRKVQPRQYTKTPHSNITPFPKPVSKPVTIRYRVKKGESLRTIATAFYGDKDKWRLIYYSNRSKIRDPNILNPGQVLNIPLETKKR